MKSTVSLTLWILAALAAGIVGSLFPPGEWYAALDKPSWNPPNGVFAPVWTTLYVLMGIAAWLVWRRAGFAGARTALLLFGAQLALNALWSALFFGLQDPLAAFLELLVLWGVIVATLVRFWRMTPAAGALLIPYLCWVSFAGVLNFVIWRLNG